MILDFYVHLGYKQLSNVDQSYMGCTPPSRTSAVTANPVISGQASTSTKSKGKASELSGNSIKERAYRNKHKISINGLGLESMISPEPRAASKPISKPTAKELVLMDLKENEENFG